MDDGVGQCACQAVCDCRPIVSLEAPGEAPVKPECLPVQRAHVGNVFSEIDEPAKNHLARPPGDAVQEAIELRKSKIAILRDGEVSGAAFNVEFGPPPLIFMSIPVAYQHVEGASSDVRPLVHMGAAVFAHLLENFSVPTMFLEKPK